MLVVVVVVTVVDVVVIVGVVVVVVVVAVTAVGVVVIVVMAVVVVGVDGVTDTDVREVAVLEASELDTWPFPPGVSGVLEVATGVDVGTELETVATVPPADALVGVVVATVTNGAESTQPQRFEHAF